MGATRRGRVGGCRPRSDGSGKAAHHTRISGALQPVERATERSRAPRGGRTMSLTPAPPRDARTLDELADAGRRRSTSLALDWTDLSPSDPGIVLLEVFAYLTEGLLYRLHRLPDTAYDSFLRLLGVTRPPQSAATVKLTFTRNAPADAPRAIPRGTRVTVARAASGSETPVFVVATGGTMAPGDLSIELTANHAEPVDGEAADTGA